MDFGNERYVRLYVRDTVTWKRLGWDGQNALTQMLRKADRSGVIDLGGIEPWESLVVLCGAPEDVARRGMARCLELECIVHDDDRLVFPRYLEAQEATQSGAHRVREHRARRAELKRNVTTKSNEALPDVTGGNAAKRGETSGNSVPCRAVLNHAVPSAEPARAHEEQNSVQTGHDLMFNATGLQYAGTEWGRQLDRIGMKPEHERRVVLEAILADPWCKANKYAVDPDHVLKRWVRYSAGNKPLQPVAAPSAETESASRNLLKLDAELTQAKAERKALDKGDPDYASKLYDADRAVQQAEERRDRAKRKLDATG